MGSLAKEYRYSWRAALYPSGTLLFGFIYCLLDEGYSYLLLFLLILPVAIVALHLFRTRVRIDEDGITHVGLLWITTMRWRHVRRAKWNRVSQRLLLTARWPEDSTPARAGWRGVVQRLVRKLRERRMVIRPAMESFCWLVSDIRSHLSEKAPDARLELRGAPSAKGPRPSLVRQLIEKAWAMEDGLAFVVVAAVLISFNTWVRRLEAEANARESRIWAANQPVDGWTLEEFRILNQDENAAPVFLAAGNIVKRLTGEPFESITGRLGEPDFAFSKAEASWAREMVAGNDLVVQVLKEAAKRPDCRYTVKYSKGMNAEYRYLWLLRPLCWFLVIRNLVGLGDSDSNPVENISLIFDIAHSLRDEPTHLGLLVRRACQTDAFCAFQHTLRRRTLSQAQLAAVAEKIDRELDTLSLWPVLVGERALGLQMIEDMMQQCLEESPFLGFCGTISTSRAVLPPFHKPVLLKSRMLVMETYAAALAAAREQDRLLYDAKLTGPFTKASESKGLFELLAWASLTTINETVEQHYSTVAELQAAKTAIHIETYRAEKGRLPGRLNEVEAALDVVLPKDPFTGRPLVFRRTERGYIVYSLGLNGKDDGGEDSRDRDRLDIAFEVYHH